MAYQVLARKWRPQVFTELVGQSHVSQTLINAIRDDRIPHALLLTGPRGTGKTSTARILAKSLRCPNAKDFAPCNSCSECEDIANSRSVDVIEIDGASNNGVDAIRELRNTVGFMPSAGKYKVYIIDEVHMLTGSAFNALLKTLEEPPPHVIFVMATTEVQKIPITVLSRCQRYDFRKISTRAIADHISEICKREGLSIEPAAAWALARQADGSMRDSQSLLDQTISFCNGDLSLKKVTDVLGLTDRGLLAKTLNALVARDTQVIVGVIESLFEVGHDPVVFMKDLLEEIRHLILIKVAPTKSASVVDLPSEEIAQLGEIAKTLGEEDIHLLFDMALKGSQDLYRSPEPRVTLEMILLRMSIAPRIQSLVNLSANGLATANFAGASANGFVTAAPIGATPATNAPRNFAPTASAQPTTTVKMAESHGLEPAPAVATTPTAAAAVTSTSATEVTRVEPAAGAGMMIKPIAVTASQSTNIPGSLNERWSDFSDRVRKVNGLVAAKLDQLHLLTIEGQTITLGVPEKYKFLYSQVADVGFQKKLVNYLNTFWGPGHEVKVQMQDLTASATLSPTKLQEKKQEIEKEEYTKKVEEHPLVKQTKSIFNTQIKSIREI